MKNILKLAITCILVNGLVYPSLYAQNLSFYNLSTRNGLSHNTITSIYQDFRGFMWFATLDGLNLYNGMDVMVYKYEKDNPNSLPDNVVKQITGDHQGNIFCRTEKGLLKLNIYTQQFSTIVREPISDIYFNDSLYFVKGNSIYVYQNKKNEEIYRLPERVYGITKIHINKDSLLIATKNGLYVWERSSKRLSHPIIEGNIFDIFKDSHNNYWLPCYDNKGLYCMTDTEIRHFQASSSPGSLSSNRCNVCCEDANGNIWVGTFEGLNCYDRKSDTFTVYDRREGSKQLSESSVWALYCDSNGTMWAGTYYAGIYYFNQNRQLFKEYGATLNESAGLSVPIVGEFAEDSRNNVWICTEGGGICRYTPSTDAFKWYRHSEKQNSISQNHVKSVYYDQARDALWIGTHLGGLNKLDLRSNIFTHYRQPDILPSDIVMDIAPWRKYLILSTFDGVMLFNPEKGTCTSLFGDNKEYASRVQYSKGLLVDHNDDIWILGTNSSINHYNPTEKVLTTYYLNNGVIGEKSGSDINSLYKDSHDRLWVCTNGDGLSLYNFETRKFENFDTRNTEISSNAIYAIRELYDNTYVLTTDKGISFFNFVHNHFTSLRKNIECPLSAIRENALYCTKSGEVFVGGMDGMFSFNKDKLLAYQHASFQIYPFRLTVNGKVIQVGDESGILEKDLTFTSHIVLSHDHHVFSIEYTTNNFLPFEAERVEYRLRGVSDVWSYNPQNIITYSNLAPGTYTLEMRLPHKADKPLTSLVIEVLPPFYRTIWAWLCYCIIVASIVYYLLRNYYKRVHLQAAVQYEKKHLEDVELLMQAKLRFFIDVSHEFRTPLTIIIGQLELLFLQQTISTGLNNSLTKIYKNCLQLKELITELLDFRKLEQGYMKIQVSEQNIVSFLYEHFQTFQNLAVKKQIKFRFVKNCDHISLWFDAKLMWKVMNNLLSNAFKHTPVKGEIAVAVYSRNDEVIIEVTDNGEGIPADAIEHIFKRFYSIENKQAGTGIGLAFTKGIVDLHHGQIEVTSEPCIRTQFTVRLKQGNSHFKEEELCRQSSFLPQDIKSLKETDTQVVGTGLQEEVSVEAEAPDMKHLKRNFKLLLIEDNVELRQMLVELFNPYYQVTTVGNGEEGLEKVWQEAPDLIVSDIMLPGISGLEICRRLKKDVDTYHIPIVLLTARITETSVLEGLQVGADDYMTKPFNMQILLVRCNNLVNNRVRLQEKYSNLPQNASMEMANNVMNKKFLDRVVHIIQDNLRNPDFTIDYLANEMGISRTKLFSKLKDLQGQTPNDFIQTIRLKESAALLKTCPQYNITEISELMGFSSPQYFRKCFKDKFHISPTDYRRGNAQ